MPRANRISCPGLVWHITHRCHERSFLLRFAKDRKRWRHWLFVASRRYELSVLNYVATSNHVHVLILDRGRSEISAAMQLIASRTAQEFNNRKNRKGAFWEDRFHTTAVQTNQHLEQCMTYIDLNMVRAGAVKHPREWDVSGYSEIQRPWIRKGVIDIPALCQLLQTPTIEELAMQRRRSINSQLSSSHREPAWSEAVGVGSESFLRELQLALGPSGLHRCSSQSGSLRILQETPSTYFAKRAAKSTI